MDQPVVYLRGGATWQCDHWYADTDPQELLASTVLASYSSTAHFPTQETDDPSIACVYIEEMETHNELYAHENTYVRTYHSFWQAGGWASSRTTFTFYLWTRTTSVSTTSVQYGCVWIPTYGWARCSQPMFGFLDHLPNQALPVQTAPLGQAQKKRGRRAFPSGQALAVQL